VDTLEQVLRDIRDQLAAGGGGRETEDALAAFLRGYRGGSRYAAPGADPDVLEQLAAGGNIQRPRQLPRGATRPGTRGGQRLALGLKALAEATPTAGGYLVPEEVAADITTMLRARSAIMRLGPRVVPVKKSLAVTSLSSGATAYWVAENALIPISEETFAQEVLLAPKDLAALVPISNRLLRDADENPDAEQVIRADMAEVLALAADWAYIAGTGAAGSPVGLINKTGLTPAPDLGANGRAPTYDDLLDMIGALRNANAPYMNPGWIMAPRTVTTLQKIKDNESRYLADAGLLTVDAQGGGGTLLGYRFVTSTQIPVNLTTGTSTDTSFIVLGSDWSEAWIGENDSLTIEASGEATYWTGTTNVSAFQARQHLFRATMSVDFALRRPQLFSVMMGVRP
jgi:HK97 family phage major capsid protein